MSKKYLYALDLSLSQPGIAIFDINTYELIFHTSIKTDSKQSTGVRLRYIEHEFLKILDKYEPSELTIERGFSNNKFTATQQIFRVHGVIECRLHQYVPIHMTPSEWKLISIGHGKAEKNLIKSTIKTLYKNKKSVQKATQDEYDAIGLGLAYLIKYHGMTLKDVK